VTTVDLAGLDELSKDQTKVVSYDGKPPYRSIVLVRIEDSYRAYWNVCKHVSIPLDGGIGSLPLVNNELICETHGARYRADNGLCVKGPCKEKSLDAIDLEFKDQRIIAHLSETD
jgi:nitrite reductase/ring-hydroxylating ferredoxin subunit